MAGWAAQPPANGGALGAAQPKFGGQGSPFPQEQFVVQPGPPPSLGPQFSNLLSSLSSSLGVPGGGPPGLGSLPGTHPKPMMGGPPQGGLHGGMGGMPSGLGSMPSGMGAPMQQMPPGPLQPPSGMANFSAPQGMQNPGMQSLLHLQAGTAPNNNGMLSGMGGPPMQQFGNNTRPNNMHNTNGQPNNMHGHQNQMQPNNLHAQQNHLQRPQATAGLQQQHMMQQQHQQQGYRPQGAMQQQQPQQNFRPPGMPQHMMQQNTLHQPNVNMQYGGARPQQHNFMPQNQVPQMQPSQIFQPGVAPNAGGMQSGLQHGLMGLGHAGSLRPPQFPQQHFPQPGVAPGVGRPPVMQQMMQASPPAPPPPSPPPEHDTTAVAASPRALVPERSKEESREFGKRLVQLRKEHPGVAVPSDMSRTYTLEDMEAYFVSRGVQKAPVIGPPEGPPGASNLIGPPEGPQKPSRKRKATGPPPEEDVRYTTLEAQELQEDLVEGFGHKNFQDELRRVQSVFPERRTKGHRDGSAYLEEFQTLIFSVFASLLPRYKLDASWDGVREMNSRMSEALKHAKVKKAQEEINGLMGIPRNAIFQPPKKVEEDLFIFRLDGDGPVPSFSRPTVLDEDGDEGHEFFVEDPETGELRIRGPTALEDSDCWYVVMSKLAVVLRSRPDASSDMVGRKKTGKRVRVQKILDGKWAQLHTAELVRLGVKEAWAPLDGAEIGSPGQQLLEREMET